MHGAPPPQIANRSCQHENHSRPSHGIGLNLISIHSRRIPAKMSLSIGNLEASTVCWRESAKWVQLSGNQAAIDCVRHVAVKRTSCSVRRASQKKHRSAREISHATAILHSSVHRIIYHNPHLKCFKRRRAQLLSEANSISHLTHSLTAALDQLRVVVSSTSNDPGPRSRQHQQIGQCRLPPHSVINNLTVRNKSCCSLINCK